MTEHTRAVGACSSSTAGFEVFFDGDCPLCRREIATLRSLDKHARITFTDIAGAGFDPSKLGLSRSDLMRRIHGRTADGTVVEGVEVFRRLYAAVGFAPLVAVTRAPPIAWLLDRAYDWFADNRLRITGRCTHETCSVFPDDERLQVAP